jgi:hypothetical protein
LSDPVARPNNERLTTVEVLKNNLNLALIIGVNDSCQSVQTVLYGKSRARRNTSISSRGELDANTGRDNDPMARKDDIVVNAEQVITNRSGGGTDRKICVRNETLNIEGHYMIFGPPSFK